MSVATHIPSNDRRFSVLAALRTTVAVMGAAIRAAAAVERRATPATADLAILGISPKNMPVLR